jgi:hypothetical protein
MMDPTIIRFSASPPMIPLPSIRDQIIDFLDGRTHGEELLHALYDHVLDEPLPAAMRALLRN